MPYFSKFSKINYDFSPTNKTNIYQIDDLMTRVTMNVGDARTIKIVFDPYLISDHEKPEMISYKLYGTPYYHWSILYVNNITNMETDWPLDAVRFNTFMAKKYAAPLDMYATRMYRTEFGIAGDYQFLLDAYNVVPIPVTYLDWETEENEKKRQIITVSPTYINRWASQFMSKI